MRKKNDFTQSYKSELGFLRDMAREFASTNPEDAGNLGLSSHDPDVERLLEGVAFLNARTQQALDADFPELLHPLLQQLWPHVLRPSPSIVSVQFNVKNAASLPLGTVIPRDTLIHSRALSIGERAESIRFSFRTCYELQILPLVLQESELLTGGARTQIRLQLKLLRRASLKRLLPPQPGLKPKLRLSLHGEPQQRYALYKALSGCQKITLRAPQPDISVSSEQCSAIALRGLGFSPDESLLSYEPHGSLRSQSDRSLAPLSSAGGTYGHRHLHEYFLFPDKHLYFDLEGLDILEQRLRECAPEPAIADQLEIYLTLPGESVGSLQRLDQEDIRLMCVPAVNLFPHKGATVYVNHTQPEYELRPSGSPEHYDIFAVQRVTATHSRGAFREERLRCFDSFERGRGKNRLPLYQVRLRAPLPSHVDGYHAAHTALGLVDPTDGELAGSADLSLESDLLVTNRDLPMRYLRTGDLTEISTAIPEGIGLCNIGRPSEATPAPLLADGLWRFCAMLGQGWHLLANPDALREMLALHDVPSLFSGKAMRRQAVLQAGIRGITELRSRARAFGQPPTPVLGTQATLLMHDSAFEYPGQFLLFGDVLSHFLAEMTTINTFFELALETVSLGQLRYPPRLGVQGLLARASTLDEMP